MIYLIATLNLHTEKGRDFGEIMGKEFLPLLIKHGGKLVAALRTNIGELDEITHIWAYESMAQLEQIGRAQSHDPEYIRVRQKIRELVRSETLKITSPMPYSPLK